MRVPAILITSLLLASVTPAQEILRDVDDPPDRDEITRFYLPYLFNSETYETAFGFLYAETGRFQPQLSWYATALGSTNSSAQAILGFSDAHLPWTERLYFDGFLSLGSYSNLRAYVDGNPDHPETRAGTNDSDPEDFIRDQAREVVFSMPFRYLFPFGEGEEPVHTYWLDRGILADGSTFSGAWNPRESGRTSFIVEPFYRRQEFDLASERHQINTSGFTLELEYDNTDFRRNPSRGSQQTVGLSRDPGWLNTTDSWTVVELEASKFFSFSPTGNQRQRVLALNFWTADTPSWTATDTADGVEISHRPPYFSGATLGGWRRLRAFPMDRFNDRSAILYTAEYRVIPAWHPLGGVRELHTLALDWWQWVAFAEVGRVASSWSLSELHRKMKWDVGLGLRFMARKQIARLDFAIGEEGWAFRVDISHPF